MAVTARRVLVAAVVLPVLYLIIRYLPPVAFFGLVAAGVLVGQYEFYRLFYAPPRWFLMLMGLVFGLAIVWSFYWETATGGPGGSLAVSGPGIMTATILSALVMGTLLYELWVCREVRSSLADVSVLIFGALYVGWLLGHFILLRAFGHGVELVLFVLLVTWIADSAAYFVGVRFGRRPLAPRISPKKTVEGAVAGLLASALVALLAQQWFLPVIGPAESVGIGLLLGCAGQLGDLSESLLKRSAGVKDSGGLIPAHGGVLDKIDSLVFAAPTFYYYLVWVKGYGQLFVI
jgi:phosphatidate cytidylyltransferase